MQVSSFFGVIALLFSALSNSQTIYTWTDQDGILHFDDAPNHNLAQAIELPNLEQPTPPPQLAPSQQAEVQARHTQIATPKPLSVTIAAPNNDEALRSNNGAITVQAVLSRELVAGEQLQLTLNGEKYAAPTANPNWQLKNIDRGSHSLVIQVVRDGKLIASSQAITVHLQRSTVKPVPIAPKA
ncbi:nitrogen regulation protein NR [Vibrio xuii]|nr:nitrogen regulation protein NR [Vibrio xuii]